MRSLEETNQTFYEVIGGESTLESLVEAFYPKVYQDPDLSPIFEGDINLIKDKQKKFLTQFLGGPPLYSEEYGAPMMRYRHLPFEITPRRAVAWLNCMSEAMDEIGLEGQERDLFFQRLTQVAQIMVNTEEDETNK